VLPRPVIALTIQHEVVGGIGLRLDDPERKGVFRHSAELGYWLGEAFWGRGIMTEAGFEYEGRLRAQYFKEGEFIDALLYAKVRVSMSEVGNRLTTT
jgi:RimJ/RimL family protein N-acetyltransferase